MVLRVVFGLNSSNPVTRIIDPNGFILVSNSIGCVVVVLNTITDIALNPKLSCING